MPPETDNLKLQELFEEDQQDRAKVYDTKESVEQLSTRDATRRKRLLVMMELDEIKTKSDLYHAAVVFQHGNTSSDFLIAHRLATLAALNGHRTARWLLAASLDRYLMSIRQGQIYGTQFEYNSDSKAYELKLPVQDPIILSFEKEMLGVPSVKERLKQLNAQIQK
ncbi:MAG: hypothetical protein ABIJ96_01505 [Elusimicrobiota bacterium]